MQFPKKYSKDLETIINVYNNVHKTHPSLGKLAVTMLLSDVANKCLLVIGCSGTGKSSILRTIGKKVKRDKILIDAITVSGLEKIASKLNYANITVLIDDLSKGQTDYSQISTVMVFAELCYSGFFRKITGQMVLDIEGFSGSCIINLQPLLLRKLLKAPEFEADIKDKAIRYYHLHFPTQTNLDTPDIGIEIPIMTEPKPALISDLIKHELYQKGLNNFEYEFSTARAKQHFEDMLRASAFINHRDKVTEADLWLVYEISKTFLVELELFQKKDLEGARKLDTNIIPLLSAMNTWKTPTITDLCKRFGLKESRVYEILHNLHEYVRTIKGHSKIYPTIYTKDLLISLGEWENGTA